jgi:hypothetical protein
MICFSFFLLVSPLVIVAIPFSLPLPSPAGEGSSRSKGMGILLRYDGLFVFGTPSHNVIQTIDLAKLGNAGRLPRRYPQVLPMGIY